jgi:hypothetical protein
MCTRSTTSRPGGTPTTKCCLKSRASTPRSARTSSCSPSTGRSPKRSEYAPSRQRSSGSSNTRCAISPQRERSCPTTSKPRFQAISEELAQLSAKFSENLLDATNAFAELVTDEAELAGLPDDARQAAREAAEKRRRKRLEVHPAHALLPAGDAIRRQPPPARRDVPGLRHARRRIRRRRARQYAADPARFSNCAGRGATARLRQLCRSLAGAEDGRVGAAGARLPARSGGQGEALCREDIADLRAFAASELGSRDDGSLGCRLRFRKAAAGTLRLLGAGSEAVLHRGQGSRRPLQGHRNACSASA